ncbi:holliday junction dna helicase ruva [hydrocarbon metagenome]|uniref:Holliday junction dna helicase ruva n=1 Tax=hydrocarbon metagenome TaxID=938273 RepID=A0A0W8G1D3_9ZZZZ
MIGYLTGKIISKKPTRILLDVNGVGYTVNISISTFEKLPDLNESASLFIHTSVKEDAIDLYGFFTPSEKEMFELLISVSGIGPKLAQSLLSGIQVDELKYAIDEGNLSRITAVPGIGRKTAERLLVELRDKINKLTEKFEPAEAGAPSSIRSDAIAALVNLGYNLKTAEKIVRDVMNSRTSITIEDVIKEALSQLNK